MENGKKRTLAALKGFVKKNNGRVLVKIKTAFSGMTDGIEMINGEWTLAPKDDINCDATLGLRGVWIVSKNYIQEYDDDSREGYYVSNCCGSFIVAIEKKFTKK